MDTHIENYIRQTPTMEWKPLQEAGIDTAGISVKALRFDENGRPTSILLKFEAGAEYPYHNHPGGEEIFVMINRAKIARGDEIWKPDALFLKFLEKVRTQFRQAPTLPALAQQLQSNEAKLNELAKLHAGKTAQMVIYGLVTSEAKRLLTYEKLSVKEVAAELGFNAPFYFSNFFKKHTGISPKGYRDKVSQ